MTVAVAFAGVGDTAATAAAIPPVPMEPAEEDDNGMA